MMNDGVHVQPVSFVLLSDFIAKGSIMMQNKRNEMQNSRDAEKKGAMENKRRVGL